MSVHQEAWPNPVVPIHFGAKPWDVVESETMEILSGDKVPLRYKKSSTGGKLYLRHDLADFNVSSFLDLYAHI